MQGQLTTGIAAQASIGSEKQNRAVIEPGKGPLKARRVAWEASLVSAIPRNLRRSQLLNLAELARCQIPLKEVPGESCPSGLLLNLPIDLVNQVFNPAPFLPRDT